MKADEKPVMAFLVYYRGAFEDLVVDLIDHPDLMFSKDGAKNDLGHLCPRMTIQVKDSGSQHTNKILAEKLISKLEVLKKNNEIVSFAKTQKTLTF